MNKILISIFHGFWLDFGWVWGLMLARKSTKNRQKIDLFWNKKFDVTGEGIKLDKRGQKSPIWSHLEAIMAHFGGTWRLLEALETHFGRLEANFNHLGATWKRLGADSTRHGANMKPAWSQHEATWSQHEPTWANLKPTWANINPKQPLEVECLELIGGGGASPM